VKEIKIIAGKHKCFNFETAKEYIRETAKDMNLKVEVIINGGND